MKKIKSGDQVIVISGRDKGKQGTVTKILSNGKCFVTGINMVKKHTKPNPQEGIAGGVVEKESAIRISKVTIYNSSSKKKDKVVFKLEDGIKQRIYRSTSKEIK